MTIEAYHVIGASTLPDNDRMLPAKVLFVRPSGLIAIVYRDEHGFWPRAIRDPNGGKWPASAELQQRCFASRDAAAQAMEAEISAP